jgi:hypothetical protein
MSAAPAAAAAAAATGAGAHAARPVEPQGGYFSGAVLSPASRL